MRFGLLVTALLAAAAATPGVASADEAAAVVSVQLTGDAPPELHSGIVRSLNAGIEAAGYRAIGGDVVGAVLADDPALSHCTSTACVATLSEALGCRLLLRARVSGNGANYSFRVELLGDGRGERRRAVGRCDVCTLSEMYSALRGHTERLLRVERVRSSFERRRHVGASTAEGPAPRPRGAAPAPHELSPATATATDGRLTASAPEPRFKAWKWVAAGGAVAAAAAGTWLVIADGTPTCSSSAGECPTVRNTAPAGIAALTAAVGLAVTSGWMFHHDRQRARLSASAIPLRRGASAALTVRF